jgi:hypothetical protein
VTRPRTLGSGPKLRIQNFGFGKEATFGILNFGPHNV